MVTTIVSRLVRNANVPRQLGSRFWVYWLVGRHATCKTTARLRTCVPLSELAGSWHLPRHVHLVLWLTASTRTPWKTRLLQFRWSVAAFLRESSQYLPVTFLVPTLSHWVCSPVATAGPTLRLHPHHQHRQQRRQHRMLIPFLQLQRHRLRRWPLPHQLRLVNQLSSGFVESSQLRSTKMN